MNDMRPASQPRLPSVDKVLRTSAGNLAAARFGHDAAVGAIRRAIMAARDAARAGFAPAPEAEAIAGGATLKLRCDPDRLPDLLPTLRYFTRTRAEMTAAAARVAPVVSAAVGPAYAVSVADCTSQIGILDLRCLDDEAGFLSQLGQLQTDLAGKERPHVPA